MQIEGRRASISGIDSLASRFEVSISDIYGLKIFCLAFPFLEVYLTTMIWVILLGCVDAVHRVISK
jgi:hypothetical protein